MVATDGEYGHWSSPHFIPVQKERNSVCGYLWETRDTDLPGGKEFLGASFHLSSNERFNFQKHYYESRNKKEGGAVPYTYYSPIEEFEILTNDRFYEFIRKEDMFRKTKGIFVIESNLVHILNFNLIRYNSTPIEKILQLNQSHSKFKPELMTEERLFKEIAEDTRLWHADLNLRVNLE